jgi:ribonuclease R
LQRLADEGQVATVKGGRFTHQKKSAGGEAVGILRVAPAGHAFVDPEDEDTSVFIPPGKLGAALDGDLVRVTITDDDPDEGDSRVGIVAEVVEARRQVVVGSFELMGKFALVRPLDSRVHREVYIDREDFGGAQDGDIVQARLLERTDDGAVLGSVERVIGRPGEPGVAVMGLALSQGFSDEFPPDVLREADAHPDQIPEREVKRRLDLRDLPIFTIDPFDAKDFDDAIHVMEGENGRIKIGVHIADVSYYVPEGSALDREAYSRGTSVYLVDRVLPMLPHRLSNGLCSLRPDEDKLAFSVLFEMDEDGTVHDYKIAETIIRSKARLAYEDAEKLLTDPKATHALARDVRRAGELAARLTKRRMKDGSIDFDTPEIKIILDEEGTPIEIIKRERLAAHRLVEEMMLLANRTVAAYATSGDQKLPLLYRIHADPDSKRIQALAGFVRPFGYTLPHKNGVVNRSDLASLIDHVKGTDQEVVVQTAALRTMAKAAYSPNNIGHYGLGFPDYAHFTSPIRRYPDLVVHRLLKRYLAHKGPVREGPLSYEGLMEVGSHTSARERDAEQAERESIKLKQVEYAAQHVGDTFKGIVTGVAKFGAFVQLSDLLVEGLVHVRDLNDYFELDERAYALVGSRSKRRIAVGDAVRVRLTSANVESRQIDLDLIT